MIDRNESKKSVRGIRWTTHQKSKVPTEEIKEITNLDNNDISTINFEGENSEESNDSGIEVFKEILMTLREQRKNKKIKGETDTDKSEVISKTEYKNKNFLGRKRRNQNEDKKIKEEKDKKSIPKMEKFYFIDMEKIRKRKRINKAEVILGIMEAGYLHHEYNRRESAGSINLWNKLKQDFFFEKIFHPYSSETLKKAFQKLRLIKFYKIKEYIEKNKEVLKLKCFSLSKIIQKIQNNCSTNRTEIGKNKELKEKLTKYIKGFESRIEEQRGPNFLELLRAAAIKKRKDRGKNNFNFDVFDLEYFGDTERGYKIEKVDGELTNRMINYYLSKQTKERRMKIIKEEVILSKLNDKKKIEDGLFNEEECKNKKILRKYLRDKQRTFDDIFNGKGVYKSNKILELI